MLAEVAGIGNTSFMATAQQTVLEAAGREVIITNPDKVFFPQAGYTKLDLAKYYAAVVDGALRGIAGRPIVLKRYVNGADGEPFFQKRAPEKHPEWVETVETGWNVLVGADQTKIVAAATRQQWPTGSPPTIFGDGEASERIVELLKH